MKIVRRVTLLLPLILLSFVFASAQGSSSVESLRSQLNDLAAKEIELQTRIKKLDEDLRPENIERVFALNGSTRPEELREQRRRQLESQKALVQTQLDQLAGSRSRLEAAIATAEAAAYRQSAFPSTLNPPASVSPDVTPTVKPVQTKRRVRRQRTGARRRRAR